MNAAENPIVTMTFSRETLLSDGVKLKANDIIFNALKEAIDDEFVTHYLAILAELEQASTSRVLVIPRDALAMFPSKAVVVPSLEEAQDIVELDRIQRDLGF